MVLVVAACGSTPGNGNETGTMPGSGVLKLADAPAITMTAGTTHSIYAMVLNTSGYSATYSLSDQPSFVMLSSNVITISPTLADAGTYPFTLEVTAGSLSDSKRILLVVDADPARAPGHASPLDARCFMHFVCAPSGCLFTGEPESLSGEVSIKCGWIGTADARDYVGVAGESLKYEAEVVPEGKAFRGIATHATGFLSGSVGLSFVLALDGLSAGTTYRSWYRLVSSSGSASAWAPIPRTTDLGEPQPLPWTWLGP